MLHIFKTLSIQYGWFDVQIGKLYLMCSNFLDCDSPKLFLKALANLAANISQEEWISWQSEPGACIMKLTKRKCLLEIELFDAAKSSDEIHTFENTLKYYCGESCGKMKADIFPLLDDILTEFSLYENGNGLSLYEEHWMPFPIVEFNQLKELVRTISKRDGYEDLFFDSY